MTPSVHSLLLLRIVKFIRREGEGGVKEGKEGEGGRGRGEEGGGGRKEKRVRSKMMNRTIEGYFLQQIFYE